jgi:hypothetical protein
MVDGETYRKMALDCLRDAGKAHHPTVRLALLVLAADYVAVADYLDQRHESGTAHPDRDEE